MRRTWRQALVLAFLLTALLTSCGQPPSETSPDHPVIKRFTVNGETGTRIISTPQTLRLSLEVEAEAALEHVLLYANEALLETFTASPYDYDWSVDASDNGFYDFRVEAMDALGNSAEAYYRDLLAINIE